jgi:predicted phosphodiesterase
MNFAIISDIHGDLYALKETLTEIKLKNIKLKAVLGDIVGFEYKGIEALRLLKKFEVLQNSPIYYLKGNVEDYILLPNLDKLEESIDYSIFPKKKEFIVRDILPAFVNLQEQYKSISRDLSLMPEFIKYGPYAFTHDSPLFRTKKDMVIVPGVPYEYQMFFQHSSSLESKTSESFSKELNHLINNKIKVLFHGHFHKPRLRKEGDLILCDVGCVGLRYEINQPSWAICYENCVELKYVGSNNAVDKINLNI